MCKVYPSKGTKNPVMVENNQIGSIRGMVLVVGIPTMFVEMLVNMENPEGKEERILDALHVEETILLENVPIGFLGHDLMVIYYLPNKRCFNKRYMQLWMITKRSIK